MKTTPRAIEAMANAEGDCYPRKDVRKMRKRIMRAIKEKQNEPARRLRHASL